MSSATLVLFFIGCQLLGRSFCQFALFIRQFGLFVLQYLVQVLGGVKLHQLLSLGVNFILIVILISNSVVLVRI